jgi:hypothetical protein
MKKRIENENINKYTTYLEAPLCNDTESPPRKSMCSYAIDFDASGDSPFREIFVDIHI